MKVDADNSQDGHGNHCSQRMLSSTAFSALTAGTQKKDLKTFAWGVTTAGLTANISS